MTRLFDFLAYILAVHLSIRNNARILDGSEAWTFARCCLDAFVHINVILFRMLPPFRVDSVCLGSADDGDDDVRALLMTVLTFVYVSL